MRSGEPEFDEGVDRILSEIEKEAIRIADANQWAKLEIEIEAVPAAQPFDQPAIRCTLRNPRHRFAVDEPTMTMIEFAETLQDVFTRAGTPYKSVTIDWVDQPGSGKVRKRRRYKYAD